MKQSNRQLYLLGILVAALLVSASWFMQQQITDKSRAETQHKLSTHLDVAIEAFSAWRNEQRALAQMWANTTDVREISRRLLSLQLQGAGKERFVTDPAQQALRNWLEPLQMGKQYLGYFLIAPDGTSLASSRDNNIGSPNLLTSQQELLAKAWAGEVVISLPQVSDIPLPDQGGNLQEQMTTIFVVAPVLYEDGQVLALLALRININEGYTGVFEHRNFDETWETLAFNREGVLLSRSRFESDLRGQDLLSADQQAILNINLQRRPLPKSKSGNLNGQESIAFYQQTANGQTWFSLDPYQNYRDAAVLGVWRWVPDFNMGLAIEVEEAEAYAVMYSALRVVNALTLLSLLLLVLVSYVFISSRRKNLEAQGRLAGIINMSENAILSIDDAEQIILFNPSAEKMFGHEKDKVLGQPLSMLIPERLRHQHHDHVKGFRHSAATRFKKPESETMLGLRQNGEEFPISVTISRQEVGGKNTMTAIVHDRSEIVRAETELRKEQYKVRHYLDTVEAIFVAFDKEGKIQFINRKACEMLGVTKQEVLDRDWFGLAPPERLRKEARASFQRIMNEKQAGGRYQERPLQAADGSVRIIAWHSNPIIDEHGNITGVMNGGLDITEVKKSEQERDRLQNQLMRAQKAESIGQLTGGIAHDFNNMLASIRGYTELSMAILDDNQPKLNNYLRQVHVTCLRAAELVQKMLAFSRGAESELKSQSLENIVETSFGMLDSVMPSCIEINKDFERNLPNIMADDVQLDQVVVNLCINARDAMEGEGSIEVRLRSVIGIKRECVSCHHLISGEFVQLSIKDSGPGITPELVERLFEPFFTTKEVGKGTGMGLAMVHGVVHAHGGHIRVKSTPGEGSEFILYFPALAEETGAREVIESPQDDSSEIKSAQAGKRILLVDDQQEVADMMSDLLNYMGYDVAPFVDSQAALTAFEAEPESFDLVLTDQTMPNLTGVELSRAVMAIRPEMPIVLFTGYSTAVDEDSALAMGIRAYVEKPVDTEKLTRKLDKLLNGSDQQSLAS